LSQKHSLVDLVYYHTLKILFLLKSGSKVGVKFPIVVIFKKGSSGFGSEPKTNLFSVITSARYDYNNLTAAEEGKNYRLLVRQQIDVYSRPFTV